MTVRQESKTKVRFATALVVVAILTMAWALMPRGSTNPTPSPGLAALSPTKGKAQASDSIDPRLRLDLLASSEDVKYRGTGKNIFSAAPEPVAIPKVTKSPLIQQPTKPAVYIPPPPPPITLKFFGLTNAKGEKPKAFLSQGEDVWIAREGDVVNRHYKIVRISPNTVEVEDLLNNNRQSIPLTQG